MKELSHKSYDLIVVGAGISGLILLKYAKENNLHVLMIEKESGAGGLWRKLPSWQDIQTPIEDWAINDTPIQGPTQPDILANILSWISIHRLEDNIRFSTPLEGSHYADGLWTCKTPNETFTSKALVIATGLHNLPHIPPLGRTDVEVAEIHSSQIFDLERLKVKRLAIIGGSASAYDLLEKAIERDVPEIHWVPGSLCWMIPSHQPKTKKGGLRSLARRTIRRHNRENFNAAFKKLLTAKYDFFNIASIIPKKDPDLWRRAIINGRPLLIKNLSKVKIHSGHLMGITKKTLIVGSETFESDLVIYATGYKLDLSFLGLEKLKGVSTRLELQRRCGSAIKSLDYPNLFFFGPTLLDTNSSTPFYSATFAKTLVAHLKGKIVIPDAVVEDNVPHWGLIRFLASFDRYNYPRFFWKLKYYFLAWYYERNPKKQVRV